MKGEYVDDHKDPIQSAASTPTGMFSKFHHPHHHPHHHHHLHHQPPPPPPHLAIAHHHFQLSNNSEEADSRSLSPPNVTNTTTAIVTTTSTSNKEFNAAANDGASIEMVRRPRGRPPGSKNKPKPPVVITRESDPSMSPYVLELPGGADIVDSVTRFCRKRNTGLCVLTGSGTVANVSLRQPSTTPGATVTFHGRFDILSISATVLPSLSPSSAAAPFANGFTISLAGPQGQIVGGAVVGQLMTAGTVYIIAASFNNPLYHRLPAEEDDQVRNSGGGGGGGGSASLAASEGPAGSGGGGDSGGGHHPPPPSSAADTMSMYSCHLPSDVIWAPTPRQAAPPHPPPY